MLSLQEIKKNWGRGNKHNTVEHQHGHERELQNIQHKVKEEWLEKKMINILHYFPCIYRLLLTQQ